MEQKIERDQIAQFGNIELLAKQVVEGFITGLHKSPFHGFSVEFAEHRSYNTGESTRHIDWKLYGRTDKLFTKKYEEETNLRCQIVIDCSSSMFFPVNEEMNKLRFSVYAAASIVELLKKQRDAVGLSLFTDRLDLHTETRSTTKHHKLLFSELEKNLRKYELNKRKSTASIHALHDIAELCHRRSLIIIFSDLLEDAERKEQFFQAIQHLKHNKHEVVIFHVVDKSKEFDLALDNRPYKFIDMESGEEIRLTPSQVQDEYAQLLRKHFESIRNTCLNYRVDFVEADIHKGYNDVLLAYLLKRQKMR